MTEEGKAHVHAFQRFHADYCHEYEWGEMCECGELGNVETRARSFRTSNSAWWHWGKPGCRGCEALMRAAGLDVAALGDEDVACREIERQMAAEAA